MNVNEYTLRNIEPDSDLTFDEHLELAITETPLSLDETLATMRQRKFLVRVVRPNDLGADDELLVINIVNP